MARPEKEAAVAELAREFEQASGIYLADFTGLTVSAVEELRRNLRAEGVQYRVVKNTLARLAATQAAREELVPFFQGPTAVAWGGEDAVAPARVLARFIKEHEKPALKAGLVEGRLLASRDLARVAALPQREVLYSQLLGTLQAPLTGLAMVLTGVMRNLVGVLSEIEKKREAGGEAGSATPAS